MFTHKKCAKKNTHHKKHSRRCKQLPESRLHKLAVRYHVPGVKPIPPKPKLSRGQIALIAGATTAVVTTGILVGITKKLQTQLLFPVQAELLPLPPQLAQEISLEFNEQTPDFEMYTVATHDDYTLEASLLPAGVESNKFVVLVHGITQNLRASLKFYPLFHRLGYHVVTYSQRNHGGNTPTHTSFGVQEKYDLQAVVTDLYDRFGTEIEVGIHGVSMGAATALQHAAIAGPTIAFTISDCAYSDALSEFEYRLKVEYPYLAWFPFVKASRLLTLLTHRFDLADASPVKMLHQVQTPVLFIHGLSDTYIVPEMSQTLYEAKTQGVRALWLVPNAVHDNCLETDTTGYEETVTQFLASLATE